MSAEDEAVLRESLQIDVARIREALLSLPQAYREVVILREYEGVSYREIALRLECPIGTVRWRMHEALRRLRILLQPTFAEG